MLQKCCNVLFINIKSHMHTRGGPTLMHESLYNFCVYVLGPACSYMTECFYELVMSMVICACMQSAFRTSLHAHACTAHQWSSCYTSYMHGHCYSIIMSEAKEKGSREVSGWGGCWCPIIHVYWYTTPMHIYIRASGDTYIHSQDSTLHEVNKKHLAMQVYTLQRHMH